MNSKKQQQQQLNLRQFGMITTMLLLLLLLNNARNVVSFQGGSGVNVATTFAILPRNLNLSKISSFSFDTSQIVIPSVRQQLESTRKRTRIHGSTILNVASSIQSSQQDKKRVENDDNNNNNSIIPSSSSNQKENDIFQESKILVSRATEVGSIVFSTLTPLLLSALSFDIEDHTINNNKEDDDNIDVWDKFWSTKSPITPNNNNNTPNNSNPNPTNYNTNADRVVEAIQKLGPTYVKFGQALASRPDIIPKSLANALCTLQDNMEPFDTNIAKDIIRSELLSQIQSSLQDDKTKIDRNANTNTNNDLIFNQEDVQSLIESLSNDPVAAASVGQVYKGYLPNYGHVAVKVQRPEIKSMVEKDFTLLRSLASLVESIPSLSLSFPSNNEDGSIRTSTSGTDDTFSTTTTTTSTNERNRLINTELVAAVDEFMSRIFEELDYTNEANNAKTFAQLYSKKYGSSIKSLPNGEGVIVPEIISSLCTKNVLVMEWIEGRKLIFMDDNKNSSSDYNHNNDIRQENGGGNENKKVSMDSKRNDGGIVDDRDQLELQENLALIEQALYVTLSQLLDTGVMHADPHGGNLLKVSSTSSSSSSSSIKEVTPRATLAYLDFGLLATIPSPVRDGLVCAVASLVFAKDVEAVASLFGELDLLPDEVISNPTERKALTDALTKTMEEVLKYPKGESLYSSTLSPSSSSQNGSGGDRRKSTIPSLEFDKLLDGLTRLVPRFKFRLPPYFINNARALGTLEGIARSLDPEFNCLQLMYPYALYRLLQNPTGSPVVEETLQSLIRSKETGRLDRNKITKLLRDTAMFTGYSRRKILMDILKTKGGKKLVMYSLGSEFNHVVLRRIKRKLKGIGQGGRQSAYMQL